MMDTFIGLALMELVLMGVAAFLAMPFGLVFAWHWVMRYSVAEASSDNAARCKRMIAGGYVITGCGLVLYLLVVVAIHFLMKAMGGAS